MNARPAPKASASLGVPSPENLARGPRGVTPKHRQTIRSRSVADVCQEEA